MDRVEALRQSRSSYAVCWAKFQRGHRETPNALFCFFEGEDVKYYSVRIDVLVRPAHRVNLNCGGKDGVLRLRGLVDGDSRYGSAWACYFVDADFDNNTDLSPRGIYVTPCYSVENLYVTPEAFERLVRDEILTHQATNESDADVVNLRRAYDEGMKSFLDAVSGLNAWIKWWRTQASAPRLRLNEVALDTLVALGPTTSRSLYTYHSLSAAFSVPVVTDEGEIERVRESFPIGVHRARVFRGKYLIVYFERLLRHILSVVTLKSPQYVSSKCTTKLTLQSGNVLSQLSQYADTPPCLAAYLNAIASARPS